MQTLFMKGLMGADLTNVHHVYQSVLFSSVSSFILV